jgi:hypothetical protein
LAKIKVSRIKIKYLRKGGWLHLYAPGRRRGGALLAVVDIRVSTPRQIAGDLLPDSLLSGLDSRLSDVNRGMLRESNVDRFLDGERCGLRRVSLDFSSQTQGEQEEA